MYVQYTLYTMATPQLLLLSCALYTVLDLFVVGPWPEHKAESESVGGVCVCVCVCY